MSLPILFHFLCAQHVSDINISIIRSLRLFCWITTLVVCSWFDVLWCFVVAGLRWYPCCRLKDKLASACYTDTTPTQPHWNSNTSTSCASAYYTDTTPTQTHRNSNTSTSCASACYTDTTPTQPHRNSNTHRNKNTRPMWWFNRKVAGSWWWMY